MKLAFGIFEGAILRKNINTLATLEKYIFMMEIILFHSK